MKKNLIIGSTVLFILIVIGFSYAYFSSKTNSKGQGGTAVATTIEIGEVGLKIEGTIEFNDLDIYPGHKNISSIKVTGSGSDRIAEYNLVWNGINTINTTLKYTVYKTTEQKNPSISCTKKEEGNALSKMLYEECTETNITDLGEALSTGEITTTSSEKEFKLVENEVIKGTEEGNVVYYYVVLEYPNLNENQNIDMGGSFQGKVTVSKTDNKADVTIAKIYLQNGEKYDEATSIPTSGYTLNTSKSSCNNNATLEYEDKLIITNLTTSNTECNVYMDKKPYECNHNAACETIMANMNTFKTRNDFSTTLTDATSGVIYKSLNSNQYDDYGETYYFAGAPTDNWVKFGGFYWRIIRINGDGTIRMIYNGPTTDQTGETTQIGTSAFNTNYNDNMYVGYQYTSGEVHGRGTDSTIKGVLDNWYNSNLKNYDNYIATGGGATFCNDRTLVTGTGSGASETAYMVFHRLANLYTPTLKCTDTRDRFATSVGLITADEATYAGGVYGSNNSGYYLYTGQYYWTLSPHSFDGSTVFGLAVYSNGRIYGDYAYSTRGARPVINLKSNTKLTGLGTSSNPYVVEGV